jgi:hypothetical protein
MVRRWSALVAKASVNSVTCALAHRDGCNFSTAHITATALITGGVTLVACLLVLGRKRGLAESVVIGI